MPINARRRPVATVDAALAFVLAVVLGTSLVSHVVPGLSPARAGAEQNGPQRGVSQAIDPLRMATPALVGTHLGAPAPLVGPPLARPPLPVPAPTARPDPAGPAVPAILAPAAIVATTRPAGPPSPALRTVPPGTATIAAPVPPAAVPVPTAARRWLPSGKGMWIYEPAKTEGGNAAAIVARAQATGLTHLWVRMGSAWDGFNAGPFLDRLLPVAHAAGIKVIGWDFPKLDPVDADVARASAMIHYTTPSGDRVDAFSPDIESPAEGTRLTPDAARRYGQALRNAAGAEYPLIVTVPRPAKERPEYPYADIVAGYDAIAPMIYWLDRQPDTDVTGALASLARFGKPVYPVGQAYDGSPEGGRKGVPPPDELFRFMRAAATSGAAGISFWSWQAANQPAWNAIHDGVEFRLPDPAAVKATTGTAPSGPARDPESSP